MFHKSNCFKFFCFVTLLKITLFSFGQNLLRNSSFEGAGNGGWWTINEAGKVIDDAVAFHGTQCLRLDFSTPSQFFCSEMIKLDAPARYTLSFFARSNGQDQKITFGFSSGLCLRGQREIIQKTVDLDNNWKRFVLTTELKPHEKNGWCVFFCTNSGAKASSIYIDAVKLEKGDLSEYRGNLQFSILADGPKDHTLLSGDVLGVNLRIWSKRDGILKIIYRLLDYKDKIICTTTKEFTPKKNIVTDKWSWTADHLGAMRLEVDVQQGNKIVRDEYLFGATPRNLVDRESLNNSMLGIHYPGIKDDFFPILAEKIGVKWFRCVDSGSQICNWFFLEPQKGRWVWGAEQMTQEEAKGWGNFQNFNALLDFQKKYGINALGLLMGTPLWASDIPEDIRAKTTDDKKLARLAFTYPAKNILDWENSVKHIVRHYKSRIHCWEIWNEPYYEGFFRGTPEDYLKLLKSAYKTIKKEDPNAIVIMGNLASETWYWTNALLKLGALDYCDKVAFHAYYGGDITDSEFYFRNIRAIQNAIEKYRKDRPIWVTETGITSGGIRTLNYNYGVVGNHVPGQFVPGRRAAAILAKNLILSKVLGVEKYFQYFLNYRGVQTNYNWVSLLELGGTPKPLVYTEACFADFLENAEFIETMKVNPLLSINIFKNSHNSEAIATIWGTNMDASSLPVSVTMNGLDDAYTVYNMMGNTVAKNAKNIYPLNGEPLYIKTSFERMKDMKAILKNASINLKYPLELLDAMNLKNIHLQAIPELQDLKYVKDFSKIPFYHFYLFETKNEKWLCLWVPTATKMSCQPLVILPKEFSHADIIRFTKKSFCRDKLATSEFKMHLSEMPVFIKLNPDLTLSIEELIEKTSMQNIEPVFGVLECAEVREGRSRTTPNRKGEMAATFHSKEFLTWMMPANLPGKWKITFDVRIGGNLPSDYFPSYTVLLNGKKHSIELCGAPKLIHDAGTWRLYEGKIRTRNAVEIHAGDSIRLYSDKDWASATRCILIPSNE